MTSPLLRSIMALVHDDIDVSFQNHGYNANMLILSRRAAGEVVLSKQVALPDDHLTDEKVMAYLGMLEQSMLEAEGSYNS